MQQQKSVWKTKKFCFFRLKKEGNLVHFPPFLQRQLIFDPTNNRLFSNLIIHSKQKQLWFFSKKGINLFLYISWQKWKKDVQDFLFEFQVFSFRISSVLLGEVFFIIRRHYRLICETLAVRTRTKYPHPFFRYLHCIPRHSMYIYIYIYMGKNWVGRRRRRRGESDVLITEFLISERSLQWLTPSLGFEKPPTLK